MHGGFLTLGIHGDHFHDLAVLALSLKSLGLSVRADLLHKTRFLVDLYAFKQIFAVVSF